MVSSDLEVLGGIGGQVPGPQTVNRSELFVATVAAERTMGPLAIITDSSYVYKPLVEDTGEGTTPPHFHFDLWGRMAELRRGRRIDMVKVKSHRTFDKPMQVIGWAMKLLMRWPRGPRGCGACPQRWLRRFKLWMLWPDECRAGSQLSWPC